MSLWSRIWKRKSSSAPPAPAPRQPRPVRSREWGEDEELDIDKKVPRRGLIPIRWQTLGYSVGVTLGVSLYTNPAMWAHLERIKHPYAFCLKVGLIGIIDLSLWVLANWAINGRTFAHRMYSWGASIVLTVAMIVHAGAVNELEASYRENAEAVQETAEGLKTILQAHTQSAADMQTRAAIEANARGQGRLAAQLGRQAQEAGSKETVEVAKEFLNKTKDKKAETFLPQWYLNGAMYYLLMVGAFILGAIGGLMADRKGKSQPGQDPAPHGYPPQGQYPYPPVDPYAPPPAQHPPTPSPHHFHDLGGGNGARPGKI